MSAAFELEYTGNSADAHELDFYDTSVALIGFQRSLALTTHLVLNGTVITQAPSLKGARIYVAPPEPGSWKITAIVVTILGGAYKLGTAPKDTPLGHLVSSAYDYVISESLGFHVDYNKTLGQSYEAARREHPHLPQIPKERLDSLTEKCEVAVRDIHRPIVFSETANKASVFDVTGKTKRHISGIFNSATYEYMISDRRHGNEFIFDVKISSYNINTFTGRAYVQGYQRPVSFEIPENSRSFDLIAAITQSLTINSRSRRDNRASILFKAIPIETKTTSRLTRLIVLGLERPS